MVIRSIFFVCLMLFALKGNSQPYGFRIPTFQPQIGPMTMPNGGPPPLQKDRLKPRFKEYGIGDRYTYRIKFTNDSTVEVKGRLYKSFKPDAIVIGNDDEYDLIAINPSDTREVSRVLSHKSSLKGIPGDSCWLFLVVEGMINCYSDFPEINGHKIIGIQLSGDDRVVEFEKENIRIMVHGDAEALKFLEKDNLRKAIAVYNEKFKPRHYRSDGSRVNR